MSDSTESQSLSPRTRTTSYRCVRWARTFRDTKQFVKEYIWGEALVAITTALVTTGVRYCAGELMELNTILLVLRDGLFVLVVIALGSFTWSFFAAPSRIYWDDQKKIAELESQLERRLDIDVNIPSVFSTTIERFLPLRHLYRENLDREIPEKECLDRGSLVILLQGLRLVNRSRAHRVSLSLTLRVRLDDWLEYQEDIENPDYLEVQAYRKFYEGVSHGQYLCNPIDIEPEGTEDGTMCFLISAEILKVHEARKLVNPKLCLLNITDHVSGEKITKNIDQRLVESTTAQVVK